MSDQVLASADNANFVPNAGYAGGTFYIPKTRSSLLPSSFTSALNAGGIQVKTTGLDLGTVPKLSFGPRVGFAYQITPKLVTRGGFGIFYGGAEEIGGSPLLTENFPFEWTQTRTAVNAVTPITPDNSIGTLETTFLNFISSPATTNVSGVPLTGFQYNWKNTSTMSENLFVQYQVTSTVRLPLDSSDRCRAISQSLGSLRIRFWKFFLPEPIPRRTPGSRSPR